MRKILLMLAVGCGAAVVWADSTNQVAEPEPTPELTAQAQFERGVRFMQERKYAGAIEAFQKAIEAQTNYFEAYNNWGISLVQLGKQDPVSKSRLEKFRQATDKFAAATRIRPEEKISWMLWGETLLLIGDAPVEARVRLACYQGAVEKCRKASELAPNEWEPLNKWGAILSTKLADFATDDATRLKLHREAAEVFAKAANNAKFSGELGPVSSNWGSALVRASRASADPSERNRLLSEAITKFERSARTVPNAAATYSMWGGALLERGKSTRMRGDFRESIDRLNASLSLQPKDAGTLYTLACAYALMDNNVMAVQTLKKCFELESDKSYYVSAPQDPDLLSLRDDPRFQELFHPPGPRPGMSTYNPRLGDSPR
jgi:Flp pilus assembly protein TadD